MTRVASAVLATLLSACYSGPPSVPASSGDAPSRTAESASAALAAPSASVSDSAGQGLATCENVEAFPGYRLQYPDDWFVLPPDPGRGVQPCSYFGPASFDFRVPTRIQGDDVPWSIQVLVPATCVIEDLAPRVISTRTETVDGFSAAIAEYRNLDSLRYNWLIELVPADDCDRRRQVFIQTASRQPGDYETNKLVVDLMARSLDVLTD